MIAINIIFVWQPCRPWPVCVPLSEFSGVLVPPWLSLALVPLPVPPRMGQALLLPCCGHSNCARGQAAANPLAVPSPLGKEDWLVPPVLSKGTGMHVQQTVCQLSRQLCKDLADSLPCCLFCRHVAFHPFLWPGDLFFQGTILTMSGFLPWKSPPPLHPTALTLLVLS